MLCRLNRPRSLSPLLQGYVFVFYILFSDIWIALQRLYIRHAFPLWGSWANVSRGMRRGWNNMLLRRWKYLVNWTLLLLLLEQLKRWERKDCKPNSLPVLQKMHVKVGDTVKVIAGHDKGKIGEVSEIFKHNSKVVVKDINLKTKHVKSRTEGESGQIIKVVNWIFTSRVFSILSWKLILRYSYATMQLSSFLQSYKLWRLKL